MNTQMTLEEYKKRAEEWIKKTYPEYNAKKIISTISKGWREKYMEEFSPEVAMQGVLAGLI
jgi:putative sterol carrier protein